MALNPEATLLGVLWSNISAAYIKKGDYARSEEAARKAVQARKNWWKGYNRLAAALRFRKKHSEAKDVYAEGMQVGMQPHAPTSVFPCDASSRGLSRVQLWRASIAAPCGRHHVHIRPDACIPGGAGVEQSIHHTHTGWFA